MPMLHWYLIPYDESGVLEQLMMDIALANTAGAILMNVNRNLEP